MRLERQALKVAQAMVGAGDTVVAGKTSFAIFRDHPMPKPPLQPLPQPRSSKPLHITLAILRVLKRHFVRHPFQ